MAQKNIKKTKLAIIGTVGLPAQYGGFESLAEQLVHKLQDDFEITVYCSAKFYKKKDRKPFYEKVHLKYLPFHANGIQSIPYDMLSILHAGFKSDILLILGVSGCLLLPFIKFFTKKKVYVNIDGIEWKRQKWNKLVKVFLRYSEIYAVETAEEVITDNQVINDYLKTTYNYNGHLIEYGGDQVFYEPVTINAIQKYPFISQKYAFSVCRIEPENNIHIILEGMVGLKDTPLVIVGNWDKSDYGKTLREEYGSLSHFYLLDSIYDKTNLNLLRSNCDVYLHGHSAGGTNPSIVEAMNLRLPIIAFDVMYNRFSTEGEALYFDNATSLNEILSTLTDDKKESIAEIMYEIGIRKYSWQVISDKYKNMMLPELMKNKREMKSIEE